MTPSSAVVIAFVAFACCVGTGSTGDVNGDGRLDELLVHDECGAQGCMFEVRIGLPPHETTPFRTMAKDCRILDTRSAGYSDIECVIQFPVEAPGVSSIRVTNRYRWTGVAYTSPLDHLSDGVTPATPASCSTVRITEPADVLMLPALGARVSVPRSGDEKGWMAGPARTPIIATLAAGARVPALEQVIDHDSDVWLLVRLGDHSTGWVRAQQTECAEATDQ